MCWAGPLQYASWVGGTALGVAGASAIDPTALGLDVLFGVFYLSLLLPEARSRLPVTAAVLAAGLTLALTSVLSEGVPVLLAASMALLGLRRGTGGAA